MKFGLGIRSHSLRTEIEKVRTQQQQQQQQGDILAFLFLRLLEPSVAGPSHQDSLRALEAVEALLHGCHLLAAQRHLARAFLELAGVLWQVEDPALLCGPLLRPSPGDVRGSR